MSTHKDDSTTETLASSIFHEKELINERPEGMDFETYKAVRYLQSRMLKKLYRHKPSIKIARLMPIRYGYNQH
jgi:hypothetical protein